MTMKEGTGSDPFPDEPDEPDEPEETEETDSQEPESESEATMSESETPVQQQSLPYIHARENVKEGREQKPIFLRDPEVVEEIVADMEDRIGDDVYKTDVLEAAVLAAKNNPEILEDELREWGYGMS